MSLILEALRKSEAQRRRGQAPDLRTELPPAPAQRQAIVSPWAWMLLVGAVVLATVWLARTPSHPDPDPAIGITAAAARNAPVDDATATMPAVPRLLPSSSARPQSAPAPGEPASVPAPPPDAATTRTIAAQPAIAPPQPIATPSPAAAVTPPPAAIADSDILQLSDLSAAERKSLPPLKVSMHLWNDDPARRFVIVDGNRLVEGDRIGDAVVTAITSDGVLLDWNGRRLKLPIR